MTGAGRDAVGRDAPSSGTILIRYRLVVRFSDCDPLGHVNNARYLTYLEQARIELWRRQAGLELRNAASSGGRRGEGFILARMEVDFRSPAHDADALEVRLSLQGFGRTSATYDYEIIEVTSGRLVASARSVVVWYDYAASRPVPLPESTKGLLARPIDEIVS